MKFSSQKGISLVNVAIFVVVLGILAAFLLPTLYNPQDRPYVKTVCMDLVVSINGFYTEYGLYPDLREEAGSDTLTQSDADLLNILRATEPGPKIQNKRKIPFFTNKPAKRTLTGYRDGYDPDGSLLDRWGHAYRVVMDTNYDNHVIIDGQRLPAGCAVWSIGPDGKEGTKDDLASWK